MIGQIREGVVSFSMEIFSEMNQSKEKKEQ